MKIQFGKSEVDLGGKYLTANLRDSRSILDDQEALQARFEDDGYLLIRGFHDRKLVLEARKRVHQHLATHGCIDGWCDPTKFQGSEDDGPAGDYPYRAAIDGS